MSAIGIPMAAPNPTGVKPVAEILAQHGIKTPVVNVPGCPPHPDWFVGTVATVLLGGLEALDVDEHGRLKAFYSGCIHDNCQLRGQFDAGNLATSFGQPGCLYNLGCKGPSTHADCSSRKWNSGVNWCIGAGSPCIGCVEPGFPYQGALLNKVSADFAPGPAPPIVAQRVDQMDRHIYGAVGLGVGAAVGLGVAAARRSAGAADKEGDNGA